MMEAGTTDQCLNTQEGAIEGERETREREWEEKACSTFPTRHSLPVWESYSAPRRKRRMRPSHILPSLCGYGSQWNNSLNNKGKNIEKYNDHICDILEGLFAFSGEEFPLASKITYILRLCRICGLQIKLYVRKQLLALASFMQRIVSIVARPDA